MAGLTITSNAFTANLAGQYSVDGVHVVDANFTITIPDDVGSREDNSYNVAYLQFNGDFELNITDTAADGYMVAPNDAGYTWSSEQNIPPAGIYLVALIYIGTEIVFKVKKLL